MSCDARSCEELSSVVPCNGMECYELKMPLFSKQLLCTTKYYSSTTLVLLRTTKYYAILLCTTKFYSSTTPFCKVLCSSTTKYYSSTTKCYSSTTLYYKALLRYYFETSFAKPGLATRVTLQLHQILRLPPKMNVISDPRHI